MASPAVSHSTAAAHRCHKGIDKLSPRSTQGANLEPYSSHSRQSSCLSDSSNQFSNMSDTSLFQASSSIMSDNSSYYDRNSSDMFSNSSHSRQASNVSDRSVHSREHSRLSDKSSRHAPSLSDMSYSQASCHSDRSSRHSRQSSQLSDYEQQQAFHQDAIASHIRQSSNISDRSSNLSRSSNHFQQSSNLSDNGNFPSTLLNSLHQRQSSQLSSASRNSRESSYDNRAFEPSPRSHRRESSFDVPSHLSPHSRQSSLELAHLSGHSRQSSFDRHPHSSMQPPIAFDSSRPFNQCSNNSPTPPSFKLPPSYQKFSPISQDQGYHTMVGPHSSPEISPGASLDLSTLHMPCPKGVVRPRPPDVPPNCIQLDHRNMTASFKSQPSYTSKLGMFELLTDDIILNILNNLDSISLVRCGQVCRRLYLLVWEPILWTKVTLTGDRIDADLAVKSILSLLSKDSGKPSRCGAVTALHLACCTRLSDAGLGVIARKCPALTHLEIRACKLVTNAGLAEVVARCTRLQHLDITGNKLNSISVTHRDFVQGLNVYYAYDNKSFGYQHVI